MSVKEDPIFIQYNASNVHALPHQKFREVKMRNKSTGKVRTVKKLDSTQAPEDIQWLRPGWNEFPSIVWKQNENHPQIQQMLKKKTIVVMNEKVTIKKDGKKVTKVVGQDDSQVRIRWFDEKRAIEIVAKTFHRELLQRWLDEETRSKVKRKLEKQIKPLLPSEQEDREDDDGDESAIED